MKVLLLRSGRGQLTPNLCFSPSMSVNIEMKLRASSLAENTMYPTPNEPGKSLGFAKR